MRWCVILAKHGGLEESQAKMLDRSLKFGETNAEELMTPRSTIAALDADDTVTDLLALAVRPGIPVSLSLMGT